MATPRKTPAPSKRTTPRKTAAQREAEADTTVEVEFDGATYALPSPDDVDYDTMRAMEGGKVLAGIEGICGEHFATIKARYIQNHGRFTLGSFNELAGAVAEAYGFGGVGE